MNMNKLALTILLTLATAQAQNAPIIITPVTPSAGATPTAPVTLPNTPALQTPVTLTVPLQGMTLEQALTVAAKASGLTVLTQNLPQVTLRAGLNKMPARDLIATLLNLYAPTSAATVSGKLLIVGDQQAVNRVNGVTSNQQTVKALSLSLDDAQLSKLTPLLSAKAIMLSPGTVILAGTSEQVASSSALLLALPSTTPLTPAANETLTRTYTVSGDAQQITAALKDAWGVSVNAVGNTLVVKGSSEQHKGVSELLAALPKISSTSATKASTVRQTYTSYQAESDAKLLSALIDGINVTPFADQNLLVVEGSPEQQQTVVTQLKTLSDKNLGKMFGYYPVIGSPADLIPSLKRELPDARIEAVTGRNMLSVYATSSNQMRVADIIRTLQSSPQSAGNDAQSIISRSINLGYSDARELADDLQNLSSVIKAPTSSQAPVGTLSLVPASTATSNVSILPDTRTNALLITGPKNVVDQLLSAITALDVPVKNVKIHLKVVQVNDSDGSNLGVDWKVGFGGASIGQSAGSLTVGYAPSLAYPSASVTLNAAQNRGNGRTLIDSNFLALSGQETNFTNGGELLFPPTTQVINNQTVTVPGQTYKYGLNIKVKPRLAPDGTVLITMSTNIGNTPTTGPQNSIQQEKQDLVSTVQIRPGETITLGGVVTDTNTNSDKGVPGLNRIPVLGALFGSQIKTNTKATLLFQLSAEALEPQRAAGTQSVGIPASTAPTTPAANAPASNAAKPAAPATPASAPTPLPAPSTSSPVTPDGRQSIDIIPTQGGK